MVLYSYIITYTSFSILIIVSTCTSTCNHMVTIILDIQLAEVNLTGSRSAQNKEVVEVKLYFLYYTMSLINMIQWSRNAFGIRGQGIGASRNFSDQFAVNRYNLKIVSWVLCMLCKHAKHAALGSGASPERMKVTCSEIDFGGNSTRKSSSNTPLNTCMIN